MPENLTAAYEREIHDTLDRLGRENGHIRAFAYFLDCAWRWFDPAARKNMKPPVAVLGPTVPEELILAAGATPYYILGGSLRSEVWSDDLVPRDTDPVSRSLLGFLQDPEGPDWSDTLFLVPASCDSLRKIAYLMKEQGRKVHVIDVPPQRKDRLSREKWQTQMLRMTEALESHTGVCASAGRLRKAVAAVEGARQALREFLNLTWDREDLLTGAARMLVESSMYYTEDLSRWTIRLRGLIEELRGRRRRYTPGKANCPGVLLMGSPVYFPNYKVPFLVQDIGLTVLETISPTSLKLREAPLLTGGGRRRETLIRAAADRWYDLDGSSAYAVNEAMYLAAAESLRRGEIEGVIYHVLKGQIEYDFELERLEKLFDRAGVPVFRLETDYQYQDVEQLRIRMEAFSEMLRHNRIREERMAQ